MLIWTLSVIVSWVIIYTGLCPFLPRRCGKCGKRRKRKFILKIAEKWYKAADTK